MLPGVLEAVAELQEYEMIRTETSYQFPYLSLYLNDSNTWQQPRQSHFELRLSRLLTERSTRRPALTFNQIDCLDLAAYSLVHCNHATFEGPTARVSN